MGFVNAHDFQSAKVPSACNVWMGAVCACDRCCRMADMQLILGEPR